MDSLDHSQSGKDTNSILCENQFLKRMYNDAMSKIAIFEQQIQELTEQNNSLRAQIYVPSDQSLQRGYKSVPASLEIKPAELPKEEVAYNTNEISIPPLKIGGGVAMNVPVVSGNSYYTGDESTAATDISHNSPNQLPDNEMKCEFVNEQLTVLNLNPHETQVQAAKPLNGLRISRGDTSIGKLFENWNAQNTEINENGVLGKRDLNIEKGLSQFDFAEPSMKRSEFGLYVKKNLISNGIEDKELMRIFAQRGISNEDFGLDLMYFS